MPLDTQVGASYVCLTCGTTYRHLIGGWTLAGPIVDLAPELQADDDPTETLADYVARKGFLRAPWKPSGPDDEAGFGPWPRHRYEDTLDEDERTGH